MMLKSSWIDLEPAVWFHNSSDWTADFWDDFEQRIICRAKRVAKRLRDCVNAERQHSNTCCNFWYRITFDYSDRNTICLKDLTFLFIRQQKRWNDFRCQIFRFRHLDCDPDRAQKLISSSMSRHLSTRKILSKSRRAFLSNVVNRQTDRQTDKHRRQSHIRVPPSLSEVNELMSVSRQRNESQVAIGRKQHKHRKMLDTLSCWYGKIKHWLWRCATSPNIKLIE